MKKFTNALVFFLFLLIPAALLMAQNQNSSLRGVVLTSKGTALPGATVQLKGTRYITSSDEEGKFVFSNVPPGRYSVLASFQGYKPVTQEVVVSSSGNRDVRLTLDESGVELGEVVVSTQKRVQSRIEVPVSVSALSGVTMDRLQVRQFDELAQYIPGLQMQLQSPNNPSYVIRGITSDEGDTRTQHRVSIFQDGVSMSRSRGSVAELFDMERVEVIKGPQGTLFGRGAQIGAVHLIQNKPVNYLSGDLALGYGNYNQKIATGFLNTPLGSDKWANRLSFYYNERDSFIRNAAGGRLNGRNVVALRNILRFQPSSSTTADLIVNYQHDNYPGTSFKSMSYAPPGGSTDANSEAGLDPGKDLHIKRDVLGLSLLINHRLSHRWALSSVSGYRSYDSDESFDADGTLAPVLWLSELAKGSQASQELRFNYDDKKRFSGFIGGSFFYEDAHTDLPLRTNEQSLYPAVLSMIRSGVSQRLTASGLPEAQVKQLVPVLFPDQPLMLNGSPNYVAAMPNLAGTLAAVGIPLTQMPADIQRLVGAVSGAPLNTSHVEWSHDYGRNAAYEVFADGTYKFAQGWGLTAGIRGSYEKQTGGYKADAADKPSVIGLLMGNYPNLLWKPTEGKLSRSKDYFSYVGRLALNYMFKSNNAYVSVSRGRRPGVIMVLPEGTTFLQPEIVWSYEAGLKGRVLNNKVAYDLSAYYYDWSHFQSNSYELTSGGSLAYVSKDAGKAHSIGLETSLQYYYLPASHLFINWACIDGKFNDEDENGNKQEYAGNRFRLTPRNTFSAGTDFNLPTGPARRSVVFIRPSYSYRSSIYFDNRNRSDLRSNAVGLTNLNLGYRWSTGRGRYEINGFAKNLFDEKYIIDAGNTGDAIGMPTYIGGTRRTVGLQLRAGF
ncbi:TonB-dependent receptor [Arcticibacter sp. MXS-1]|uniref:TonB-dependent receptor n=1 Tax=Arcticibacter sp. MXS-1 TaxID=3341726 RepID=UPI0035A91DA0